MSYKYCIKGDTLSCSATKTKLKVGMSIPYHGWGFKFNAEIIRFERGNHIIWVVLRYVNPKFKSVKNEIKRVAPSCVYVALNDEEFMSSNDRKRYLASSKPCRVSHVKLFSVITGGYD